MSIINLMETQIIAFIIKDFNISLLLNLIRPASHLLSVKTEKHQIIKFTIRLIRDNEKS